MAGLKVPGQFWGCRKRKQQLLPGGKDTHLLNVGEVPAGILLIRLQEDQPQMTVSLKVDQDTKMGIVTDIKEALRQAYALKINYSAQPRQ